MGNDVIDKASKSTAKYFGFEEIKLYSATKSGNVILAKHLLWHYLHYECGISVGKLSKSFYRSKRNVYFAVSKIKEGLKKQKYYQRIYEEYKNEMQNESKSKETKS